MDEFWEDRMDAPLLQEFAAELNAELSKVPKGKKADGLRKQVQHIFNEAYKKHNFSYKKYFKRKIVAHGLPEGIEMTGPGQYTSLFVCGISLKSGQLIHELFPDCHNVMLFTSCLTNPPSHILLTPGRPVMFRGPFFMSTMQAGTTPIFKVFGMTGPSMNRESNLQNHLVNAGCPISSPFYVFAAEGIPKIVISDK